MGINYLISIFNLYISKESDKKILNIDVTKKDNLIKFDFSYTNSRNNKTFVKLEIEEFNKYIKLIIDKLQYKLDVSNENYIDQIYSIEFNNKRQINFIGFSIDELNKIKTNINNSVLDLINMPNTIEIKDDSYNEIYQNNTNQKLVFSMGFSSFITIFLTAIWFLDIFMIALWVFKSLG